MDEGSPRAQQRNRAEGKGDVGVGEGIKQGSVREAVPAEAVQPVAQVVRAAHQHQAPRQAQVPEAALQLLALALLRRLRAVLHALLQRPHLGREALRRHALLLEYRFW